MESNIWAWENFLKKECQRRSIKFAYRDMVDRMTLGLDEAAYYVRLKDGEYGQVLWISLNRQQLFRYNVVVLMADGSIEEVLLPMGYYLYEQNFSNLNFET
jgi:hypothetical protein